MTAAAPLETSPRSEAQLPFALLKRPFLLVAVFLIPGIVLGHFVHLPALSLWYILPLFMLLLIAAVLLARHSTFSTSVSMLCVSWVGFLLGVRTNLLPPDHVHFEMGDEQPYELVGVVVEEPVSLPPRSWEMRRGNQAAERCRFTIKTSKLRNAESANQPWKDARGKVQVYAWGKETGQLKYGDRVELAGTAFLPEQRRNPGGLDFRRYLAQDGIYFCMRADKIKALDSGHGSRILRLSHALKSKFRRSFMSGDLNKDQRSFLHALILGERRDVGPEFSGALRRTNTMHILAISGLHVAALAGGMYFLLSRRLLVPQWISSIVALGALWVYAPLTGMRVPIVRASIMCTAFLIAPLLGRRTDSINSLAVAAVIILCIRPGELFTAGFQLSFMVVLSILLLSDKVSNGFVHLFRLRPDAGFLVVSPLRRRAYRALEYPLRLFSVSLAAFVGFAPLGLVYFNQISLLGPPCNMATIVLVGFIVPLGFVAGVVGTVSPGVAGFLNTLNGALISALHEIVTFFASASFASLNVSPPGLVFVFSFYSFVLVTGFARSIRQAIIPIALAGVLTIICFVGGDLARRHPGSVEVTFLDVGQGDCAFVEFPDGRRMLVDGGSATRSEVGRYVIVPFLRWSGVNRLDAVIVTHYDADHINALSEVLRDIRTRLVVVRAGPAAPDTAEARSLLSMVEREGIPLRAVRAGEDLSLSTRMDSRVLNPPEEGDLSAFSENDLSVVLRLDYGSTSVLLCGDIEAKVERRLVREGVPVQSEVLKVPHHGSNSSSLEEFIRSVRPEVAVVSCGRGNPYGHPAPPVLERYERLGIRVFRTDRDGAIVVRVLPNRLRVTTTL